MEIPLWTVLLIIGSAVLLLVCLVTTCAVRCFRPQNSRGSDWFVRKDGKEQLVRGPFSNGDGSGNGNNWLRVKDAAVPPAAVAESAGV